MPGSTLKGGFVKALLTIVVSITHVAQANANATALPYVRPPVEERRFVSPVVDKAADELAAKMRDPDLATLWRNSLPITLDTTVASFTPEGQDGAAEDDAFIVTGDIPAMWLRDSVNQVGPYWRYAKADDRLKVLLRGLLRRHARMVLIDPFANAFNYDAAHDLSPNQKDVTTKVSYFGSQSGAMQAEVFERKFELDSLMHTLKLSRTYFAATGDRSPFDARWLRAVATIVKVLKDMQEPDTPGGSPPHYTFQRQATEPTDTLLKGVGWPSRRTGMVRSPFRPSDDATAFQYHIPSNAMAAVECNHTAALIESLALADSASTRSLARAFAVVAADLKALAADIEAGLMAHGRVTHSATKALVWAYEVDGYGNALHMDDGNIPSLLSLPYLGFCSPDDTVYRSTRAVILAADTNPWYFDGSAGKGVGGPHTGAGFIWPLGLIMQARTSTDDAEIAQLLELLKSSAMSTGVLHESFWFNDVTTLTRRWFAWAGSQFAELIQFLAETKPHIIFRSV